MFSKPVKKYKREQSWLFFVKGCFCLWVFMCVYMLRMETICSAKKALFLNVNWCRLIGFSQSMPNTVQAQCLRNSYAQLFNCIIFPEAILNGSIVKKVSYISKGVSVTFKIFALHWLLQKSELTLLYTPVKATQ